MNWRGMRGNHDPEISEDTYRLARQLVEFGTVDFTVVLRSAPWLLAEDIRTKDNTVPHLTEYGQNLFRREVPC
jgi:hypothetical protein